MFIWANFLQICLEGFFLLFLAFLGFFLTPVLFSIQTEMLSILAQPDIWHLIWYLRQLKNTAVVIAKLLTSIYNIHGLYLVSVLLLFEVYHSPQTFHMKKQTKTSSSVTVFHIVSSIQCARQYVNHFLSFSYSYPFLFHISSISLLIVHLNCFLLFSPFSHYYFSLETS